MTRYKINIEYDGTNLVGWQKQKNGLSVQEILENSLYKLSGEKKIAIVPPSKDIQKVGEKSSRACAPTKRKHQPITLPRQSKLLKKLTTELVFILEPYDPVKSQRFKLIN